MRTFFLMAAMAFGIIALPAMTLAAQPSSSAGASPSRSGSLPEGVVKRLGTLKLRAAGAQLAISADGKHIVGLRGGTHISIWDAGTGELKREYTCPDDAGSWSALSPDGAFAATIWRGKIRLWDVQAGKWVREWDCGKNVGHLTYSPDGRLIAATAFPTIHVWETDSGKEVFQQSVKASSRFHNFRGIYFSLDGRKLLATIFGPSSTICWDIGSGKQLWEKEKFWPAVLAVTSNQVISIDSRCPVLDLETGQAILEAEVKLPPVKDRDHLIMSSDGRYLLILGDGLRWFEKQTILWDLRHGKELLKLDPVDDAAFAPNGKTLVTTDGRLQLWDLERMQPRFADNLRDGHSAAVTHLTFTADGKRLISGADDGTIRIWEVDTGRSTHFWQAHKTVRLRSGSSLYKMSIKDIDLTPDGRLIASAGYDGWVHVHSVTGKKIRSFEASEDFLGTRQDDEFVTVRLSRNGTAITIATYRRRLLLPERKFEYQLRTWDIKTGELQHESEVSVASKIEMDGPQAVLSVDGRRMITRTMLFDTRSGALLGNLDGKQFHNELPSLTLLPRMFTSNGLLVGGIWKEMWEVGSRKMALPSNVRVWDAWTGKTVAHIKTKTILREIAFHPSSRYVAMQQYVSRHTKDRIVVRDLLSGKEVFSYPLRREIGSYLRQPINTDPFTFSPDGQLLATGHADGTILLWQSPWKPLLPKPPPAAELEKLWEEMGSTDPARAWRATWQLMDYPEAATALLKERLRPVKPAPAKTVHRLLEDLDSNSFRRRQAAMKELQALEHRAESIVRQAMKKPLSLEQHLRMQDFLDWLQTTRPPSPATLQKLRALTVLKQITTKEATQILEEISRGVASDPLTQQAQAALARRK